TRLQGDWSSDVCSSDLEARLVGVAEYTVNFGDLVYAAVAGIIDLGRVIQETKSEMVKQVRPEGVIPVEPGQLGVTRYARVISVRSEERRVGKECRSGGW